MRLHFFLISLLLPAYAWAQQKAVPSYTLTTRAHYGFIWNFSPEVAHLSNQHLPGFELNLTRQTKGAKSWQQIYRYPQTGYSFYYFRFDPSRPVGDAAVLLIHAGRSFIRTKRCDLQWRIGIGTGYVERRFEANHNYKNNIISSRFNFAMNGDVNANLWLSRRTCINLGLGIVHLSNGSVKKPNFGINLPTMHAGIGIRIREGAENFKKDSLPPFIRKNSLHLSTSVGLKEVYPVNGPKYGLIFLSAYGERRINRKSGINLGIDMNYDDSKRSEIKLDTIPVENNFINRSQLAIVAGHELYIHKLSMLTQLGVYLHDPTHLNRNTYQRIGLKYYISDKIFMNVNLKIHLGIADWVEWGAGIRL